MRPREALARAARATSRGALELLARRQQRLRGSTSAQPRYCVFASSRRSAPRRLGQRDDLGDRVQVLAMEHRR